MSNFLQRLESCIKNSVFLDCAFLFNICLLYSFLYTWDLGFYSDDWHFLRNFTFSPDVSILGLYEAFSDPNAKMRPGQKIYQATLFWFFELDPTGYHVTNIFVFSLGAVFFYLSLRQLGTPRIFALSIPLVFIFLPHFSTVRFWYAANQAVLAMTLYFASLYADLRSIFARTRALLAWKAASIVCLVLSTLSYEVLIPLFLLNPIALLFKYLSRRKSACGKEVELRKIMILTALHYLVLFLVVAFKLGVTTRLGDFDSSAQLIWFARLLTLAVIGSYVDYGVGLPATFISFFGARVGLLSVASGLSLGIACYAYVRAIAELTVNSLAKRRYTLWLLVVGLTIFFLGYAVFLAGRNAIITPTGINNRIAIAAGIGVAVSFLGAIGWASSYIGANIWRAKFFSGLVVFLVVTGFLINLGLAGHWREANFQQQAILKGLRENLPKVSSGHTVILDGVCTYSGPAPIFEAPWDLEGALALIYRDPTLRADIVTPTLLVSDTAIETNLYGAVTEHFFEQGIVIYNHKLRRVIELPTAEVARQYFEKVSPKKGGDCPLIRPGYGEPVLGGILDLLLHYRFGELCNGAVDEDGKDAVQSRLCQVLRLAGEKSN